MEGWNEYILGDLVNSISETYKFKPDENVVFLNTSDIYKGKVLNNSLEKANELPGQAKKRIKNGDFLFSEIRPANGRFALVDFDVENYVVSTKLMVLRCSNNINVNFLIFFLTSQEMLNYLQMLAEDRSGTFPQITFDQISSLEILLPPLSEQRAIAAVLSSFDDKIDLLHRQNKTLEAMAETLFRQWFVEEAGEDWEEGTLGDVATNVRDSLSIGKIDPEVRYVGLEHIDRRTIALRQSGLGADVSSNKYEFQNYDILFGKLRPYFHKVCLSFFSGVCSTDILVIRPKNRNLIAYSLFAFFQDDVVEYANLGSGGTRMPRTDWTSLKKYPIKLPNDKTLDAFTDAVVPFLEKVRTNIHSIDTLENLRDTLLPKLMSGEVRVAV